MLFQHVNQLRYVCFYCCRKNDLEFPEKVQLCTLCYILIIKMSFMHKKLQKAARFSLYKCAYCDFLFIPMYTTVWQQIMHTIFITQYLTHYCFWSKF